MGERAGLTRRALLGGLALGALAAASNLYVSLKTGWSLPVMTTAVLVFAALAARRPAKGGLRAEAAVLAATASGAGYMAGGGNAAALPALVMLGERAPSPLLVAAWWCVIAVFGTLLAPLLAARTVDDASLPYPTARATVAIAESLDAGGAPIGEPAGSATGERPVARAARALAGATAVGALVGILQALRAVPSTFAIPGRLGGRSLASLTFGIDASVVLVGAGALMNLRTALSTLAGGLATYALAAPMLLARGHVERASYRDIVSFMVWPAAALLVSAAISELALDAPRWLGSARLGGARRALGPLAAGLATVVVARVAFGMPVAAALAALPVSVVIAFVAARAMGETDVVPTKALAPLAQLTFGAAFAEKISVTMAPNVTSGAALHAADTLASMRVGRALGASDRSVLVARVAGCVVGALVAAFAYRLVVPDATALPTADLPAPAVLVWRSVSEVLVHGAGALDGPRRVAIVAGAGLGVSLTALERWLPRRLARLVPSAAGLGSGMVLPASNSLAIAAGALARASVSRGGSLGEARASLVLPVASGLVAGESLVGIATHAARALHVLVM